MTSWSRGGTFQHEVLHGYPISACLCDRYRLHRLGATNDCGDYDVPALNIGQYEVSVEHAGFRKEVVKGIVLVVNQRARVDWLYRIAGGWQTNGVLTLETGLPFYPTQTLQPLADECSRCTRRPDRIGNGNLPGSGRTLQRWFNTSAFALAVGHYGSSGRNILTAPGLTSLDFSLFKNFRITESRNLQGRWELYNATNTPPFNPPNRSVGTGTFGQITSADLAREMQFGLRLEF